MAFTSTHAAFGLLSGTQLFVFVLCAVFSFPLNTFAAGDHKAFSCFEIEVIGRTGFFPSPAYTVSIIGSGRVTYLGYKEVHWKGKRHVRMYRDAPERRDSHQSLLLHPSVDCAASSRYRR